MNQNLKTAVLVAAPLLLVGAGITIPTAFNVPITFSAGIKTDSILNSAGTSGAPGMVPIGGMVAVMASTANAWQPPTSGQCKDGFARADGVSFLGHATCTGAVITATPPSMVAKYPRGNTTSGNTGGNNTATVSYTSATAAGQVFTGTPAARSTWFGTSAVTASFSGDAVARSGWFGTSAVTVSGVASTYNVSVPGHYHGKGTLAASGGSHDHSVNIYANYVGGGTTYAYLGKSTSTSVSTPYNAASNTHSHSNAEFSGYVGNTATGSAGDTAFTASGTNTPSVSVATANDNMAKWAAAGSYTPTGSVPMNAANDNMADWAAAGSYTPAGGNGPSAVTINGLSMNSGNNEPDYVEVVWVIRVK